MAPKNLWQGRANTILKNMFLNLVIILLLFNPLNSVYLSDRAFFDISSEDSVVAPERIHEENVGVKVSAEKFVAIDIDSGKILLQKNVEDKQAIASITKLMTALVILDEEPDWTKTVKLIKGDETYGAYPHLYRGEEVLFEDLWQAALIASDNNSIRAMIRSLNLSLDEFALKMNTKAKDLGMYNTSFADPTGLSENNLSTALDVSLLLHAAMQNETIQQTVLQGKYEFQILNNHKKRTIYNTDILISSFLNSSRYGYSLIGGKTGYLPEAGYCLAAEIVNTDHPVAIIVLNSSSIESRFQDVKVIADWVFSNYTWK